MPVPESITDLSTNPASNYPAGSEQVFPNLDNYLRFHAACLAQLRDRISTEGLPLASVMWWGGARASIQSRFAPMDGQFLSRATYPALWAMVSAGGYPLVTEAAWVSDAGARASFSVGDGATNFRMPDLNGKHGGIGAVTVRGDGTFSAAAPGRMQDGQNLSHGHGLTIDAAGSHVHGVNDPGHAHGGGAGVRPTGVHYVGPGGNPYFDGRTGTDGAGTGIWLSAAGHHGHSGSISADGGSEARMKSATGAWVMRVK